MFFLPYLSKILIPFILVASVLGAIWGYGHYQYKAGERAVETLYLEQRLQAEQENNRLEAKRNSITQEVVSKYAKKSEQSKVAAIAAKSELDGLRSDLAALGKQADTSCTTPGTDGTAIYRELLGECAARYTDVAESAQQASNRLSLLQSWLNGVLVTK